MKGVRDISRFSSEEIEDLTDTIQIAIEYRIDVLLVKAQDFYDSGDMEKWTETCKALQELRKSRHLLTSLVHHIWEERGEDTCDED